MKKILFIVVIMASSSRAAGPILLHKDPAIQRDFQEISDQEGNLEKQVANGFVNVKNPPYNATGNGTTDDTGAINSAIANSTGNIVYVPAGQYYIGTSQGIKINVSSIAFVCNPGATLLIGPNQGISINTIAGSTLTNVTVDGCRMVDVANTSPNAGISMNPGGNEFLNNITLKNLIINGMGQYGIVGGGVYNWLTIENVQILNNGPTTGQVWGSQGMDILPDYGRNPSALQSHHYKISNVYIQENGNSTTSAEMDGAKIQVFSDITVTNLTIEGGGNASVTGACLIISSNTQESWTNVNLSGPASTGLIIETSTSTTAQHNLKNFNIDTTYLLGDAVVLGVQGATNLTLDGFKTKGDFTTTAFSTYTNFNIKNCEFDTGIGLINPTIASSTFMNNICIKGAFQINGYRNKIINNISIDSPGNDSFYILGSSNVGVGNLSINTGGNCVRFLGNTNTWISNTCINPTSNAVIIGNAAYMYNLIGVNFGNVNISDSGSNTTLLGMTFGSNTNNTGANTATMTNAPVAGNPVWRKINDSGTIRSIAEW